MQAAANHVQDYNANLRIRFKILHHADARHYFFIFHKLGCNLHGFFGKNGGFSNPVQR